MSSAKYIIVGIDDEQDSCDCCGKTGLKRVVRLMDVEGYVVAYGTTCAAKARKVSVRMQKADEKSFERKQPRWVIRCAHSNDFIKDIYLEEGYTSDPMKAKRFTKLPESLGNCVFGWDDYDHDGHGCYFDMNEVLVFRAVKLR